MMTDEEKNNMNSQMLKSYHTRVGKMTDEEKSVFRKQALKRRQESISLMTDENKAKLRTYKNNNKKQKKT